MTRSILAALAATAVTILSGTGGCNSTGVGDPCTPEAEYSQAFLGFDKAEVNIEAKSFQCQTRLCLANHFQGRVTCPYGQARRATADPPATAYGTGRTMRLSNAPSAAARPSTRRRRHDTASSPPCHDSVPARGAAAVPDRTADTGGLLLLPLRQRRRADQRRCQLLHLPERLLVHAAGELGRRGPTRA